MTGSLVTTEKRKAGADIWEACFDCAPSFLTTKESHNMTHSPYGEKRSVHVSISSTLTAEQSQRTVRLTRYSCELGDGEQHENTRSLSSNLHVSSFFHGSGGSVTPSVPPPT